MLDAKQMREYTAPVQDSLDEFNRRLADYMRDDSPLVTSIARHLLRTRGKRIRPAFLFLTSAASGTLGEHSVDASLAIELIHTATLLHDDVVDESEMRRGKETVNTQWTNLISVLMGDYLFAKAFRIMMQTKSIELMTAISRATERVSVGELRQIEETGNLDLSEDEYLTIIADKTASLFTISCEAGPILCRFGQRERQKFATFGEKVGTAFQIADDLLDYVGDPEQTGKNPGNDLLTGKMTLPLIYSLRHAGKRTRSEIGRLLRKHDGHDPEVFGRVFRFVADSGGIDYAYARAGELSEQGLRALAPLAESPYLKSLADLVAFATRRAS